MEYKEFAVIVFGLILFVVNIITMHRINVIEKDVERLENEIDQVRNDAGLRPIERPKLMP